MFCLNLKALRAPLHTPRPPRRIGNINDIEIITADDSKALCSSASFVSVKTISYILEFRVWGFKLYKILKYSRSLALDFGQWRREILKPSGALNLGTQRMSSDPDFTAGGRGHQHRITETKRQNGNECPEMCAAIWEFTAPYLRPDRTSNTRALIIRTNLPFLWSLYTIY